MRTEGISAVSAQLCGVSSAIAPRAVRLRHVRTSERSTAAPGAAAAARLANAMPSQEQQRRRPSSLPERPPAQPKGTVDTLQEALFEAYWKKKKVMCRPHLYPETEASKLNLAVVLEESHESITSVDFDALSSCPHCRYPCHLRCSWRRTGQGFAYSLSPVHGIDAAIVPPL